MQKCPCPPLCPPTKEESFGICMLQFWRHISLPHNAINFCFSTFAPPNMFIKVVKFENQKLLSPFNLCPCLTLYMHYPIKTKDNFYPWKLCCPIILELKFIRQHQLLQWSFKCNVCSWTSTCSSYTIFVKCNDKRHLHFFF